MGKGYNKKYTQFNFRPTNLFPSMATMSLLAILTSTARILLLSPAQFVLRFVIAVFLPVIIIGNYLTSLVFGILSLPFVVFSRLQELYIFCGVAAVIGISTGAILGLASYFLTDILDFRDEPRVPGALGRTRLKKERIRSAAGNTATATAGTANTKVAARVLFPRAIPTILEEEDEDSPFLVSGSGGKGIGRVGRGKRVSGWSSEDEVEEEENESSG